ncbi:MAG: orotate phosphoribosyltransferase [Actinomycetota bacterium]|nr:orotate phosphoribosyltransferase [Actinomycetota bacterium]
MNGHGLSSDELAYPRTFAEAEALSDQRLKEMLVAHLSRHSVLRGDFVLKSGRTSGWFIDAKKTACDPAGQILVAALMLRVIPAGVDGIGGLTMGADPVAFTTAAISSAAGRPLYSFSVRKEAKDHGAGGRIAGIVRPGTRVVITEDAVTRGTSIMEAVNVAREAGAEVAMVTAMVDRGGTVAGIVGEHGIPFVPLVTAEDLGFAYEGA